MGKALFGLVIYLATAASAFAYGAIAAGSDVSRSLEFTASTDQATPSDAAAAALQACRNEGLQHCAVRRIFQNTCVATGLSGGSVYEFGLGYNPYQAQQNMIASCVSAAIVCMSIMTACDGTSATQPAQETPLSQQQTAQNTEDTPPASDTTQNYGLAGLFVYLGRFWSMYYPLAMFAGAVLSVSLFRLAIALVLTAPAKVLKERTLICGWLCIPATASLVDFWSPFYSGPFGDFGTLVLPIWSNVFAALILGGLLRKWISTGWKAPAPLSLPLATFAFTSIAFVPVLLYLAHGGVPFSSCGSPPYAFLSLCNFLLWQGAFLIAVILLVVVACGAILPAESNLVVAYNRLGTFIRKSVTALRSKRIERTEDAEQLKTAETAGSYPVPALYSAPTVDAMRLKLKRSQRSGAFGKVIFVLDARMELTRDEYELLRKYRLGSDVIYESSSRLQRKEATQAHLEMTKGGARLTDSAGAQLMGVAKTLFWFGRASISATAASLSLRITINSLISGVHVECKSMAELLGAENAIREAARNLRGYLDVAVTFDGREEIVELK